MSLGFYLVSVVLQHW